MQKRGVREERYARSHLIAPAEGNGQHTQQEVPANRSTWFIESKREHGRRDLNPQPPDLESGALPIELHP